MDKGGFIRDVAGVSVSKTISFAIKFLIGVLLARLLGPEGRGLYATLLVVPMIVISFTELGVRRSTIYHIGKKIFSKDQIVSVLLILLIFSSIIGIAASAYVYYSLNNPEITLLLIVIALLSIPVSLIIRFSRGILIGSQQYRKNNVFLIIPPILNLLSLVIFVWWLDQQVFGALISLLVSNLIVAVLVSRLLFKNSKFSIKFDLKVIYSLLRLGFIYAVAMILVRLNYKIDLLLLEYLTDLKEVGFYSLGASLAEQWQIPFATGAVIISKTANSGDKENLKDNIAGLFRLTLLVSVIVFGIIYILIPYLLPLIYGTNFTPSIPVVRYILPGVLFLVSAKIMGTSLAGMMKTGYVIWVFLIALIINVVLNFYFIPEYGGIGAAISTDISYCFGAVATIIIYCRITGTGFIELMKFRKQDFRIPLRKSR